MEWAPGERESQRRHVRLVAIFHWSIVLEKGDEGVKLRKVTDWDGKEAGSSYHGPGKQPRLRREPTAELGSTESFQKENKQEFPPDKPRQVCRLFRPGVHAYVHP